MTMEEFEERYCLNSRLDLAEYQTHLITLPCQCGDISCEGWAAVANNPVAIKAHAYLYE